MKPSAYSTERETVILLIVNANSKEISFFVHLRLESAFTIEWDMQFPEMKGFSVRNLKYMRKFAEEYPDHQFVQEVLAQLTWYHNVTLLDKISDKQIRLFYVKHAIEHSWSRNIMVMQMELSLHKRQGQASRILKINCHCHNQI